jgi:hypothetical protein
MCSGEKARSHAKFAASQEHKRKKELLQVQLRIKMCTILLPIQIIATPTHPSPLAPSHAIPTTTVFYGVMSTHYARIDSDLIS